MTTSLNYKILVAEELSILNYDIKCRLKKNGFGIIERTPQDDILKLMRTKTPDLIITSLSLLKKIMPARDLYNIIMAGNTMIQTSDTVIFDKEMCPLIRYPKPFDSNDILAFIYKHLNNLNHENN
jgi:hypothetical protein